MEFIAAMNSGGSPVVQIMQTRKADLNVIKDEARTNNDVDQLLIQISKYPFNQE